ncbi:hypothetical protein CROQUDRAFT_101061 [Cronartium quercuum f. sp. fusiforme G11]|uniref:Retrovirus-related Pol polyprotein from transposon TNT 1-94-like beta-barrel domain-containing protein n=1 Tax=Cronartium quercuum f. sp. fusiforme G11 TaxID=708437 RepID=A0A9P6N8T4_9BASI|nr:hypothetical protein CROQUDRAFT_101061 [Cronartium quercuum f. sp. fusiforme G11]
MSTTDEYMLMLDCATTSHMFGNKELLQGLRPSEPSVIRPATKGTSITALNVGSFKHGKLKLERVLHALELAANLILVGSLYDAGYTVETKTLEATIKLDGKPILIIYQDRNGS